MTYTGRWKCEVSGELQSGMGDNTMPGAWNQNEWIKQIQLAEAKCQEASTRASADLDAKTDDLAKNWKPTGFYTVADFQKVLEQTWAILTGAGNALDKMLNETFEVKETARKLRTAISTRYGESLVFVQAMNQAKNTGITIIDAPGLKRWVIKAMNEASIAYEYVAYMACIRPFFLDWLSAGYAAFDVIVQVGKALVKITVAAGQAVLKVPDFVSTMWDVAVWGGGAVGVLWLVSRLKPKRA